MLHELRKYRLERSPRPLSGFREYAFDLFYGVDTRVLFQIAARSSGDATLTRTYFYQPTAVGLVGEILKQLPIVYEDYTLIDMGSGKGRFLLLASHLPFTKIIGIEVSPTLHETACRNIWRYRSSRQRCFEVESRCVDASLFRVPDDKAIFYFYNPFDEHVMATVLSHIRDSLLRRSRQIYIIYSYPIHHHVMDESGFLVRLKEGGGAFPQCYFIYANSVQNLDVHNRSPVLIP